MKKTILLIEDSKVQKLAGERMLLKAGYLVLTAGDGAEGLRLARESVPDLVLLDMLLPEIGGEEILGALKGNPRTEQIPVIIVSHLPPADIAKLKAVGAAEYFHKSRFLEGEGGEIVFLSMIEKVLLEVARRKDAGARIAVGARTH